MSVKWIAEFTVPPDDSGGVTGVKFEDGGQAAIVYGPLKTPEVADTDTYMILREGPPEFFVRLQSWDETGQHAFFRGLMGKKVRVTVETVDGE